MNEGRMEGMNEEKKDGKQELNARNELMMGGRKKERRRGRKDGRIYDAWKKG